MQHIFYIFSLTLVLFGCVKKEGESGFIKFSSGDAISVPADGISELEINVTFSRVAYASEKVTFYTENGSLSKLPITGNGPDTSSVTFHPKNNKARVFLRSSTNVDTHVRVSVQFNDHIADKIFSFTRACPDEILFTSENIQIHADSNLIDTITLELLNSGGDVSDKTRVEFSVINPQTDTIETIDSFPAFITIVQDSFGMILSQDTSFTYDTMLVVKGAGVKLNPIIAFSNLGKIKTSIQSINNNTGSATIIAKVTDADCTFNTSQSIPIEIR